jgi:hypothetical protein
MRIYFIKHIYDMYLSNVRSAGGRKKERMRFEYDQEPIYGGSTTRDLNLKQYRILFPRQGFHTLIRHVA